MTQLSGIVCGYCSHVREAESLVPEWQCPACKTAYAKAQSRREREQFPSEPVSFRTALPAPQSQKSKFILPNWLWQGGVLLALFFVLSRFISIENVAQPPPAVVAPAGEVWLFTRNGCGYCKKVKDLLADKGYNYTELNVDTDANAGEMFKKLQAPGVPVTLVGDLEIIGYNPDEILKAVKKARK